MTEYQHKENSGTAFKNRDKTEDWHSDYGGTINVAGTLHFLNVYVNKDKNGQPYFGVKIGKALTQQEPRDYERPATKPPEKPTDDLDDDIPF